MNRLKRLSLTGVATLSMAGLLPLSASGDELRIPVGSQAPEKQTLDKPRQGTSKADVEARFGEPLNWNDAVGDPPISSWEYPDYIVFFEHDLVLHTVLKTTARPIED